MFNVFLMSVLYFQNSESNTFLCKKYKFVHARLVNIVVLVLLLAGVSS
jgi:hypothetical protein